MALAWQDATVPDQTRAFGPLARKRPANHVERGRCESGISPPADTSGGGP